MPPPRKIAPKITPTTPVTPATPAAPAVQRSEFKASGTSKPVATSRAVTQEQIAKRAYEIYASRGYAAGDPTADWLEAERQLKAGL